MPLSYKNILSGNKLKDALTGDGDWKDMIKKQTINPKYIKGYESETFWESSFGGLLGLENKQIDPYDPYTTDNAKKEEFWGNKPGRVLFPEIDENVNTFRNVLYPDNYDENSKNSGITSGWSSANDQYEDPLQLGFEIAFDTDSPFFGGDEAGGPENSMGRFMSQYFNIGEISWRNVLWTEFTDKMFTIFERNTDDNSVNYTNKPYYINKIKGLNNLNKKIIKYGEDKLTITLNEDVRMISWYLSELYNNLVYSYKNKRMMFPENLIRFNLFIKIHDFRNFTVPLKNKKGKIEYKPSPKSTIMYMLHDCSFNFFNSYNFGDELTMAGYGASKPPNSELEFDIIYKSATRWSNFPLLNNYSIDTQASFDGDPLENIRTDNENPEIEYFQNIEKIKREKTNSEAKGFFEELIGSASQTVANAGLNYLDNLETHLREKRGEFVNSALQQFRDLTTINKIEPDNVYNKDFNNRISLKNAGKKLASDLLNDFGGNVRNMSNF